jgi:K+-transporting ATPase A subunit
MVLMYNAENSTDYFAKFVSYACKMFIKSSTGANVIKHFSFVSKATDK